MSFTFACISCVNVKEPVTITLVYWICVKIKMYNAHQQRVNVIGFLCISNANRIILVVIVVMVSNTMVNLIDFFSHQFWSGGWFHFFIVFRTYTKYMCIVYTCAPAPTTPSHMCWMKCENKYTTHECLFSSVVMFALHKQLVTLIILYLAS